MAGINKVILLGNLGRDPEVHTSAIGTIVNLAIATSESWTDKASGERKERTQWHRVVIYNERLGEVAEKYLTKGSKVYIEGQNETRKYMNKDGVEVYTTEVVLRQFRGELQLVDSRGQGDDREGDRGRGRDEDRGRDDRNTRGRDAGRTNGAARDDRRPARDDDRRPARDDDRRPAAREDDRRAPPPDDRRAPPPDDRRAVPRDDARAAAPERERPRSRTEADIEDEIPF